MIWFTSAELFCTECGLGIYGNLQWTIYLTSQYPEGITPRGNHLIRRLLKQPVISYVCVLVSEQKYQVYQNIFVEVKSAARGQSFIIVLYSLFIETYDNLIVTDRELNY